MGKLKYESVKRSRIKSRFFGLTTNTDYWFDHGLQRWVLPSEKSGNDLSNYQHCNSVRAFRRRLKNAPKGVEFILCNRYKSQNVKGIGSC